MGVVVVCCGLVLVGLVAIVRWGGLPFNGPPSSDNDHEPSASEVARRYVWFVAVATATGLASGLLMAGAGGRLVMRLLAATAGDGAQGKLTEAEEVVGQITTDGTIGFIIFGGLGAGLLTAVLYLIVRRWLPAGRLGGLAFGALVLLALAPAIDPLRRGNEDFDIVGPGWVAIAAFSALALAHGMLVAAIAARYGNVLPLWSEAPRSVLVRYAPVLLLFPLVTPALVVVLIGLIVVAIGRGTDLGGLMRRRGTVLVGRALMGVVALASLPRFVGTVVDIAGRGP
jgi:hypothetical protein